jgi:hypothetical protein
MKAMNSPTDITRGIFLEIQKSEEVEARGVANKLGSDVLKGI